MLMSSAVSRKGFAFVVLAVVFSLMSASTAFASDDYAANKSALLAAAAAHQSYVEIEMGNWLPVDEAEKVIDELEGSRDYWYAIRYAIDGCEYSIYYPRRAPACVTDYRLFYCCGKDHADKANERAVKLAKLIHKKAPSNKKKQLRLLHDWLCRHVKHYEEPSGKAIKISSQEAHQAYGALVKGRAWCSGYSEAFSLVASYLGFNTRYCTSNQHNWNEVKLGKKWLAVDAVGDDEEVDMQGASTHVAHTYFLKSYAQFRKADKKYWDPAVHKAIDKSLVKPHRIV